MPEASTRESDDGLEIEYRSVGVEGGSIRLAARMESFIGWHEALSVIEAAAFANGK
jgi:hypothetical protein